MYLLTNNQLTVHVQQSTSNMICHASLLHYLHSYLTLRTLSPITFSPIHPNPPTPLIPSTNPQTTNLANGQHQINRAHEAASPPPPCGERQAGNIHMLSQCLQYRRRIRLSLSTSLRFVESMQSMSSRYRRSIDVVDVYFLSYDVFVYFSLCVFMQMCVCDEMNKIWQRSGQGFGGDSRTIVLMT